MVFVCPQPLRWNEIYSDLLAYYKFNLQKITEEPPILLNLSGWHFSDDFEKKRRWEDMVAWANKYDCSNLIQLEENEKYLVTELSSWVPYANWDLSTKNRPTPRNIEIYSSLIKRGWSTFLDSKFSEHTYPNRFTGKKLRRLEVVYSVGYTPPWGSWTNHLANGKPSKFTELRRKINDLISPHAVDHIDFVCESKYGRCKP